MVPESVIYLIIEIIIPLNVKEKNRNKNKKKENLLPRHIVGKLQARLLDYLTSKFHGKANCLKLPMYIHTSLFLFCDLLVCLLGALFGRCLSICLSKVSIHLSIY